MDLTDQQLEQLRTIPVPVRPGVDELVARMRRRRRRRIRIAVALTATAAVAAVSAGALLAPGSDENRVSSDDGPPSSAVPVVGDTAVPDVVGLSVGEALRTVRGAGLVLSVSTGDPAVEGAIVLATEPGAGTEVRGGAVVGARTALRDPPVEAECPYARHPRGEVDADALPPADGLSRSTAETAVLALREQVPESSPTEIYLGIWDRWAYSGSGEAVTVAPAEGFQVIVVTDDGSRCPAAPQVRGVPVTYVIGPIDTWAGRPLVDLQDEASIEDVAEGVAPFEVAGEVIWILRTGDEITAFTDDAQHLPGDGLMWCPSERVFAGPNHGELFDEDGTPLAGPASHHLDRYPATISGDTVRIRLVDLIPGRPNDSSGSIPDEFSDNVGAPWDTGPGSFCHRAVHPPMIQP